MVEKIPINCLKNVSLTENELKDIQCTGCKGVLYDPVISLKNNFNYCKKCLFDLNNINVDNYIMECNINNIYRPISKTTKMNLNKYKYICPNYDFSENNEKEYSYDDLINHLIDCGNNKIKCPYCNNEQFLKFFKSKELEKLNKTIMENVILERELESQKLVIKQMEIEKQKIKENNAKVAKIEVRKSAANIKKKDKKMRTVHSRINQKIIIKAKNISVSNKNVIKINTSKNELPPVKTSNNKLINSKKSVNNLKTFKKPNLNSQEKPIEKPPMILDNSKNMRLFDKCPHFYGNYMPKFACCGKFYGCYLCHNENENHPYQFSNKVACLFCKNVYAGKTCPKCKANQLFQRKKF